MRNAIGAVGALVLVGLGWLYLQATEIVSGEHERFARALSQFRELDAGFNQDVLRIRFRLLEDYDSLGRQLGEMRDVLTQLTPVPRFVDPRERAAIEAQVAELRRRLEGKADSVERFKSRNAILKNSLRYFPLGGSELTGRLASGAADRGLEAAIDALMAGVLTYIISPGAEQERAIDASIVALDAWRAAHPRHAEAAVVASLGIHVRTILRHRPAVDALVQGLLDDTPYRLADQVRQIYELQFAASLHSGQRYRRVLYAACLVLLAGVVYALLALRAANRGLEGQRVDLARKNRELQAARDDLERRVAERTGELDAANRALQAANEQLSDLALYDALTGLPNRLLLESRLAQATANAVRDQKRLALMFIDLDRFKPVNDTYGHAIGDALLAAVANRLSGCIRKGDTVSRTGGDEFVVLLGEIEYATDAAGVAAKMLAQLGRPFELGGHTIEISGSIGIGVYPDDARDATTLKTVADEAMYYAKRHGRSSYRFHAPQMALDVPDLGRRAA